MKIPVIPITFLSISLFVGCDPQSGITKKSLEKFGPTPTPSGSPAAAETPVDPADIVQVDTTLDGPTININTPNDKMNVVCDKFNRLRVNSNDKVVTVKGACSQIMINGDRNDVTAEAVTTVVFNGSDNKVHYSRFGNGKRPVVTDNKSGNLIDKVSAAAALKK